MSDDIELEDVGYTDEEKEPIPAEHLGKYIVYFCYEWNDMDSCIKLYVEVDKRQKYTNTDLMMYVVDQFNGIAELEDGSLYNLMAFKQAYVIEQDPDFQFYSGEDDDEQVTKNERIVEIEPGTNIHKVDFGKKSDD